MTNTGFSIFASLNPVENFDVPSKDKKRYINTHYICMAFKYRLLSRYSTIPPTQKSSISAILRAFSWEKTMERKVPRVAFHWNWSTVQNS